MSHRPSMVGLQKKVATAERAAVLERWRYGRALLADPRLVTPAGTLRPGVTEQLARAAREAGLLLSEREIERRVDCARTYGSEDELQDAAAGHEDWAALAEAGFPYAGRAGPGGQSALVDLDGRVTAAAQPWRQPTPDAAGDRSVRYGVPLARAVGRGDMRDHRRHPPGG